MPNISRNMVVAAVIAAMVVITGYFMLSGDEVPAPKEPTPTTTQPKS